ncbi:MAG: hypothetical protein ACREO3_12110 [Arenimonas sp.]
MYWTFPRSHAVSPARRRFDVAVLVAAVAATTGAMLLAYRMPWADTGSLWPQVIATLAAYHAFLIVLAVGWFLRGRRYREPD